MLSDNMFESSYQKNYKPNLDYKNNNGGEEVFNIRDNKYSYEEAQAVCKAYDSKLATLKQIIKAYKNGANWCSYGWSDEQMALYPTQSDFWNKLQSDPYRKNECGKPGVNGGYFENPNYKFGVNCYGVKPRIKSNETSKNKDYRMDPQQIKINQYKEEKNDIRISPFSNDDWSYHRS